MARTYRRRGCRYDYVFVLWDIDFEQLTMKSSLVRKRLAHFHGDSFASVREPPPRNFRNTINSSLRSRNRVLLAHWLKHQDFDLHFHEPRRCPSWFPM
jgi:hypothetical protein